MCSPSVSECNTDVDVETQERRHGLVGTQFLDHEWSLLEECIPRCASARTDESRRVLDSYIRAAQWRHQVSTSDAWEVFTGAAQRSASQWVGSIEVGRPEFHSAPLSMHPYGRR